MLQRYRYRILASFRVRRYGRSPAVSRAKAGLLAVEVSPTVEQRTAMSRRGGSSRLVENVCLSARLYGRPGQAGRAVTAATAGHAS
ncbi:MAG TPA: hypothetical protein VGP57_00620 [Actinoplanes sp.]|jgi:hypothetical protein|nr:hypothetical protein [Actinoplanes sp.]